jgi:hypothetical protein
MKLKINITIKKFSVDVQIFDALYVFLQSLNSSNYQSMIDITMDATYSRDNLNILCDYMPNEYSEQELTKYDLIFYCNGGEPLAVATDIMKKLLDHDNVFLIANSYLHESHQLAHKVFWYPHNIQTCRDYWTRNFYPQYFENIKNKNISRDSAPIAINGTIRTNRHYLFTLLKSHTPTIQQYSNIGKTVRLLNDAYWESMQDTKFKEWLNKKYNNFSSPEPDRYYDQSPTIGIDSKFGKIPPGYFIMPEYFKHPCVIFPESGWQNNELNITEKALKCFYAGSLPFPIGGANINRLYNDVGYYTAWNLLPIELKQFDQIEDHATRYQMAVAAITWLNNNRAVFQANEFATMTTENKLNFLTCKSNSIAVDKLFNLIKTKLAIDIP